MSHPAVLFHCRVVDSDAPSLLNAHWRSSVGGPSGLSNHSACLSSHIPCFSSFLLLIAFCIAFNLSSSHFAMSAIAVMCFTSKALVRVVSWAASSKIVPVGSWTA